MGEQVYSVQCTCVHRVIVFSMDSCFEERDQVPWKSETKTLPATLEFELNSMMVLGFFYPCGLLNSSIIYIFHLILHIIAKINSLNL